MASSSFFAPLGQRDFRILWQAEVASLVGDWAARLALAVLVYSQTNSAFLTALTYVAALLPSLGPGQYLTALTDRFSRRTVMLIADLARMVIFALVAFVDLPVIGLLGLIFIAGLASVPFSAARSAATVELPEEKLQEASIGLMSVTDDFAVMVGAILGGTLATAISPEIAILFNSVSFAISALMVARLPRMAPDPEAPTGSLRSALRFIVRTPLVLRIATLATLAASAGAAVEALIVPHFTQEDQLALIGPVTVAVAAVTLVLVIMLTPPRRRVATNFAAKLAAGASLAAGMLMLVPGWAAVGAFVLLGALFVPISLASIELGPRFPAENRGACYALLGGGLTAVSAVLIAATGFLATYAGPPLTAAIILIPTAGAYLLLGRGINAPLEEISGKGSSDNGHSHR